MIIVENIEHIVIEMYSKETRNNISKFLQKLTGYPDIMAPYEQCGYAYGKKNNTHETIGIVPYNHPQLAIGHVDTRVMVRAEFRFAEINKLLVL